MTAQPHPLPLTLPPGTRAANGILLLTEGRLVPDESSYTASVRFESGREMLAGLHARVIDWSSVVGGAGRDVRPVRVERPRTTAESRELSKPHPWSCDD